VPEDIADYYKGEAQIILEEFTLSLIDLPEVIGKYYFIPFLYVFKLTNRLSDALCTFFENLPLFQHGYNYERKSVFSVTLNIEPRTTSDNFEAVSINL
jgi:hypothetical protein